MKFFHKNKNEFHKNRTLGKKSGQTSTKTMEPVNDKSLLDNINIYNGIINSKNVMKDFHWTNILSISLSIILTFFIFLIAVIGNDNKYHLELSKS